MLEPRLTIQENRIIVRHAWTLKVRSNTNSVIAIATPCPVIASQRRFKRVLGFIQLSFKKIWLLIKFIIPKAKVHLN